MPGAKLHLYGKGDPRPGRKMGHLTALADTPADAIKKVLAARDVLLLDSGAPHANSLCARRRPVLARAIAAIMAAVVMAAGRPAHAQAAAVLAEIDRGMEHYRLDAHIPGMVWGVVKDGRLVHVKGAGVQDSNRSVRSPPTRCSASRR